MSKTECTPIIREISEDRVISKCPVCRESFEFGEFVLFCPLCDTVYHCRGEDYNCWEFNKGCAKYSCDCCHNEPL